MTASQTIADRILNRLLLGDGCRSKTHIGVDRLKLVVRIATDVDQDWKAGSTTWTFADGSEIADYGGGWDTPEGWAANT